MTPGRWQQVESLVEAALELDVGARASFLDAACGDDRDLRREVEALLESLGQVDSFMERPAFHDFAPAVDPAGPGEPAPGDRVGRYRILHEIGRGGMSTVYAAARDDREYEHRVAIKLIRPGMHSGAVAQRFRRERQILANLDHPNIARLLDGGTAEDGRPYVVMELIEGLHIDRYCDRGRLSVRRRLELFREVCAAVDYAHRNLVVHRDIKPSNILVTGRSMPKLLDFGIAKLLDPTDFPHTVEVTRTGLRPMTPPYASPEQVLGQAITTASDVYSLGVLLYKLLTGRLPQATDGGSTRPMHHAPFASQVTRPSQAFARPAGSELSAQAVSEQRGTHSQQLRRQLAGDLDNIVLTALRQEPERRYGSVERLSEDLRRHLEGLPVSARRDTFGYRAGKFLRRNKLATAIAGTSVALVLGFAATMAAQTVQLARQRDRARRERDKADRERDKAERISAFLIDLFDLADPDEVRGSSITAQEILDRGLEKIDGELEDQPDVQASLMSAIGRIYRRLGLHDRATPLLEQALERKRDLWGEMHVDVADTLNELALLYSQRGLYEQAGEVFQRTLEIRSETLGSTHPRTAEVMINFAASHLMSGDSARAEALIENAMGILETTPDLPAALLAHALNVCTFSCTQKGEYGRAEEFQKRALELLKGAPNQLATAIGYANLGNVYSMADDYDRAQPIYRRALGLFENASGEQHLYVAICTSNIGMCHSVNGEFDRAESHYRRALEAAEKTVGYNHPTTANILNKLAILYRQTGRPDRAESFFTRALEAYEESVLEPNIHVAYNLCQFARFYHDRGRLDRAEPLYQRAADVQKRVLGSSHIDLAESLSGLADLYTERGRYEDARVLYDRSLAVAERAASRNPRNLRIQALLAAAHLGLGDWHCSLNQQTRAGHAWRRALAVMEDVTARSAITEHLDIHGRALLRLNRIDDARPIVERLLAIGWCAPDFLERCRQHGLAPRPAVDA